uniref:Uncharacterized protein n=1 Tax=Coccolithus braarudii TaxID=221442 RepID=A0A7S0Q0P6_9EUKA
MTPARARTRAYMGCGSSSAAAADAASNDANLSSFNTNKFPPPESPAAVRTACSALAAARPPVEAADAGANEEVAELGTMSGAKKVGKFRRASAGFKTLQRRKMEANADVQAAPAAGALALDPAVAAMLASYTATPVTSNRGTPVTSRANSPQLRRGPAPPTVLLSRNESPLGSPRPSADSPRSSCTHSPRPASGEEGTRPRASAGHSGRGAVDGASLAACEAQCLSDGARRSMPPAAMHTVSPVASPRDA